jgi:hypothetical protein
LPPASCRATRWGVEAAQHARRYYGVCRRFYDRKAGQVNGVLATKALTCKLSKAGWHVMWEGVPFNWQRAFGCGQEEAGRGPQGVKAGESPPSKKQTRTKNQ